MYVVVWVFGIVVVIWSLELCKAIAKWVSSVEGEKGKEETRTRSTRSLR